jgi:serine O-acetyltransferase
MNESLIQIAKKDIARWVIPGEIGDPSSVDRPEALKLIYRHRGLRAVLVLRLAEWSHRRGIRLLPSFLQRLIDRRYGLDVLVSANIGAGLYIAHPVGVTLAPKSMGTNCSVIAAVTIGMRNEHAFTVIGDHVFLGAGCRVLGGITVGSGSKIGANAVVVRDVPSQASVGGVPAIDLTRGHDDHRRAKGVNTARGQALLPKQ